MIKFNRSLIQSALTLQRSFGIKLSVDKLIETPTTNVEKVVSAWTANQKQILHDKIATAIKTHQMREGDTGSSSVQISVLTEKIVNLTRHFAKHKKDYHSKRGFEVCALVFLS
jgi:ribosomal protein S15P/S13E